ncbi:hypothetical protein DFH08DRAFT_963671 [Mycena albidolilacea]|uniref:Uncharacterized protein n=1 Tax=Mycena albidolilacea TaxID=1033008 RepID=A0AAD6ZV33_9AGAR|nr:hypothetical protein DFH08DRAFT_963671 [Mycena albidolilacea]
MIEDLGLQEAEALSIKELLNTVLAISQDEIEEKSDKSFDELTEGECTSITCSIVDVQLNEDTFDALSDDLKALADFFLFSGCCSHKDSNMFAGGCRKMGDAWPKGEEPVLLANKAKNLTIRLGQKGSAVVKAAENASAQGIVKVTALLSALLRHKDKDKGYQDNYWMFMEENLFDLCGETNREFVWIHPGGY